MPQSKQRKAHKHDHKDYIPHEKEKKSIVPVAIVVCMILGLGIGWFAAERSVFVLITGIVLGGVVGYFAGKQMDKTFNK